MEELKMKETEEEQTRLREEAVQHTKKVIEDEIRKEKQQEKEVEEQQITLSFMYNYKDIEYIPKWNEGTVVGETYDEYSNILLVRI
jgi:hypothetical protein